MELEALQEVLPQIQSQGASLLVVSPQLERYSKQVVNKNNLTYPVLCDQSNTLATRFNIAFDLPVEVRTLYNSFGIDLERFNGDSNWRLPMPSRYIIDTEGTIVDHSVSPDYGDRPDPRTIINVLSGL